MQDVIFSGTETRKPLSFASVAITLDNSDHKLPVDFNEVTVTRRLYRSGESEYQINGSACRLKDINEMFYDTGIGREGYSIIGQGQVDKILSGKPEERRELFDEAAGIVKFKRRKNATIKKLEDERQNLVRVTDILTELTRQLEPLEKQSETARIYLAKRETLKELDVNMFLLEYAGTAESMKELEGKHRLAQGELDEAQKAYEQTKVEYDRLEQELEQLNHEMEALRSDSQEQALKRQQMEGQVNVLNEQILAGVQNEEHYQGRLASIEEEVSSETPVYLHLPAVTYDGDIVFGNHVWGIYGSSDGDDVTTFTGTVSLRGLNGNYAEMSGIQFKGNSGIGVNAYCLTLLSQCSFDGWDTAAIANNEAWVNAMDCTFTNNKIALKFNSSMAYGTAPNYLNNTFTGNGTAVCIENLPGNEVLDFAGSTFSENDVDIDNKAEHSVDTAKANFETASE